MLKYRTETLEDLLELHRRIKCNSYEFDEIGYTLLLCDINAMLRENKKYKEVINKAIKYIEENKQCEYRNRSSKEYYLELNEKEMTKLLSILKEVEHE